MSTLLRRKEETEDDKLHKEHKLVLERLLNLPENKRCADCGTAAPRWASASLGVFLCMSCSGVHRSLGTHISFVRSISLDKWKAEEVKLMQSLGNTRAAEIWEARLPADYRRPSPHDSVSLERFIRDKYVGRRFYKPPSNNNTTTPTTGALTLKTPPPPGVSLNPMPRTPPSTTKPVPLRSPHTSNVSTSPRSYKKTSPVPPKSASHQPVSRSALIPPTTTRIRPQSQSQVQPRPEPRPSPQAQVQSVPPPQLVTVSPPQPPVETELLFVVDNPVLSGEVDFFPPSATTQTHTLVETELVVVPVPVHSHSQPEVRIAEPLPPPSVVDVNSCKKSNIMSMFEQQPQQQQQETLQNSQEPVYYMQQMYYSGRPYGVPMYSDGHYPNPYLVMQYPQYPPPQQNSQ